MALEKVKNFLANFNKQDEIQIFTNQTASAEQAANELQVSQGEIAKTLSFKDKQNRAFLIVVSGDKKIDNAKFKAEFGFKANMLKFEEVEPLTGFKVGGVCPFVSGLEIYLDSSLKAHKFIYPACGTTNSAIKLSINELENIVSFVSWVDVCLDK